MAQLPVYHSRGNITPSNTVSPVDNPLWGEMNKMAEVGKDLAVKWQKIKNDAETLDGKEKLERGMTGLLEDAQTYTDYQTQADIDKAEKSLLERNNELMDSVASGFTNQMNADHFRQTYKIALDNNAHHIRAAFRGKTSDLAKSTATMSYDRNKKAYIETGNKVFKESYLNDLKLASPFYSHDEMAKMTLKVNEWDFDRASSDLLKDPEGTLANLKNYDMTEEQRFTVSKAAVSQIEHKKWYQGISELVEKGTEGNRLYNKFMEQGLSLDEIQNNEVISDAEKTALMKLAGYDTATFKNAKAAADSITAQLELDEAIKSTIKESGSKYKLQKDKNINDLLKLREQTYSLLLNGNTTKEKASLYLNKIIGAELNETKKLASEGNKNAVASNPYAEGLVQIDNKLGAQGIDNKKIMAGTHNLYFEAMQDLLEKEDPEGKGWTELPESKRQEIQNKATSYALANVPNVAQAKEEFSYFLPSSKRKAALDDFMSRYNPEMSDNEKKALINEITSEQRQKAEAETNMALANSTYNFEADENFLTENGITKEDVVFTAQKYGVSVEEVLQKIRGQ